MRVFHAETTAHDVSISGGLWVACGVLEALMKGEEGNDLVCMRRKEVVLVQRSRETVNLTFMRTSCTAVDHLFTSWLMSSICSHRDAANEDSPLWRWTLSLTQPKGWTGQGKKGNREFRIWLTWELDRRLLKSAHSFPIISALAAGLSPFLRSCTRQLKESFNRECRRQVELLLTQMNH